MGRFLLLGDLHLSTTGPSVPAACPDLDDLDIDAVVSIGDLVDDNADHASDPAVGAAYEERGRAFLSRLNDLGVPVLLVPGNHDPVACTRRLADGFGNVRLLHREVLEGADLPGPGFQGVSLVGWGCEKFDLRPAFRYTEYPGIVPARGPGADTERTPEAIAVGVETVVTRFLVGDIDATAAAEDLGVAPSSRVECVEELETLAEEFQTRRSLLESATGTTVLLSHETPFNVAFDYHHSESGDGRQFHVGSLPLKAAIAAAGPDVVLSGHMHTEGRDAIGTTAGYADIYNPGSPGIAVLEVDADDGSLRVVRQTD